MVARATETNAVDGRLRISRIVATGETIYQGQGVTATTETTVSASTGATSLSIGVAAETEDGTWPATAGDKIVIALLGSPEVVKVRVGSGGSASAGAAAKPGTSGCANATEGGGTGVLRCLGVFVDTGVAYDIVGLNVAAGGPCVGS
jgi:hypothetical protein